MTKVLSVSPKGRIRKTIADLSLDQKIMKLNQALGLSPKDSRKELKWLNAKIAARSPFQVN